MAHLEDTQKSTILDFSTIEKLIWQYQSGKLSLVEALSFGTIGTYVVKLVESPKLAVLRNGEPTGSKMAHMVIALREQEEFTGQLTGNLTGRKIDGSGKKAIKLESPFDVVMAFDGLFSQKSNDPSAIGNWRNYWRMAYASDTNLLIGVNLSNYRVKFGLGNPELWQFVKANWQHCAPEMLRSEWQEKHPITPEPVKEKPVPAPKAKKATTKKGSGFNAIATALDKAKAKENAKAAELVISDNGK